MKPARERLRSWREAHQLPQHELARRLDISQQLLSSLETGERAPGLAVALRIQKLTSIPSRAWIKPST